MSTPLTDTETTRLLERLADTVPDHAAPVAALLADARRARRRRRGVFAGVASAVVVAVVATGLSLGQRPGQAPATGPVSDLQAPSGTVLLGVGDLVVEVPDAWVRFEPSCGRPFAPYVYFLPVPALGCIPLPPDPPDPGPALGIGDTAAAQRAPDGEWTMQTSEHGVVTERFQVCQANETVSRCQLLVRTPGSSAGFALEWDENDPDQRVVAETIADSVQRLPEGWTTVPYVDQYRGGRATTEAIGVMEDAGLVVAGPVAGGRVAATEPIAGTVVEEGSTVTLLRARAALAACTVTLTQGATSQTVHLWGQRPAVRLDGPGFVDVDLGDHCPWDLGVSAAVSGDKRLVLGERTTRRLDVHADDTHIALTYQSCASTAPGCRGPETHRLFPITWADPQ